MNVENYYWYGSLLFVLSFFYQELCGKRSCSNSIEIAHLFNNYLFFFFKQFDSPLSENLWKQVEHVLQVHLVLNSMG